MPRERDREFDTDSSFRTWRFYFSQHGPATRPSVEKTADKASEELEEELDDENSDLPGEPARLNTKIDCNLVFTDGIRRPTQASFNLNDTIGPWFMGEPTPYAYKPHGRKGPSGVWP